MHNKFSDNTKIARHTREFVRRATAYQSFVFQIEFYNIIYDALSLLFGANATARAGPENLAETRTSVARRRLVGGKKVPTPPSRG